MKPVGAGIILASNAMQVFDKLGFRVLIENNSTPVSSIQITKGDLTLLSKIEDASPQDQDEAEKNKPEQSEE